MLRECAADKVPMPEKQCVIKEWWNKKQRDLPACAYPREE